MQEIGRIVGLLEDGNVAEISLQPGAHCGSCRACNSLGGKKQPLHAKNIINATVGERVVIQIDSASRITGSLLVFLFPILVFIGGFIIATGLFSLKEEASALVATGVTVAYFFFLSLLDKSRRKRGLYSINIIGRPAPGKSC